MDSGELKTEFIKLAEQTIEEHNRSWSDFYAKNKELEFDDFPSDFQQEA